MKSFSRFYTLMIGLVFSLIASKSSAQQLEFKIINYKKSYNWTDNIVLSVKNTSNKAVWFSIGEEIPDGDKWIEYNLDISNLDPTKEVAITFKSLRPHELKIINVNLKKINIPPRKKHGVTKPTRFLLRFRKTPRLTQSEGKIASQAFTAVY